MVLEKRGPDQTQADEHRRNQEGVLPLRSAIVRPYRSLFACGIPLPDTERDLKEATAIVSAASTAFAMGPRKRSADFGDGLVEIFIQPRDLLLLFPEFFRSRCRFAPSGGG